MMADAYVAGWYARGARIERPPGSSPATVIQGKRMARMGRQSLGCALLTDVPSRIADHKINRIDELLPWRYAQQS